MTAPARRVSGSRETSRATGATSGRLPRPVSTRRALGQSVPAPVGVGRWVAIPIEPEPQPSPRDDAFVRMLLRVISNAEARRRAGIIVLGEWRDARGAEGRREIA